MLHAYNYTPALEIYGYTIIFIEIILVFSSLKQNLEFILLFLLLL